ncbi:MAG: NERD domain-containing protein [Candidatus Bathyarchaeota archaeon]|nr:NERD domain-containing protein [Candidatus Bathyarchaeota archaeon]
MTATTDVLIALLKQTGTGNASNEDIAKEAKVPVQVANNILGGLREIGAIEHDNEHIELSSNQRVKLAIHAINNGTDIERVSKVLEWKEFENFTATAFEKNNYEVKRNFRFKAAQRRWEIDVLAISEPIIVCVDCKRWRRGWGNSAISRVADAQAQRTQVLANSLHFLQQKAGVQDWEHATLFPVILSLFPGPVKFYSKVPVVPILQLQNFVDEFLGYTKDLAHFQAKMGPKLSEYLDGGK